MQVSLIDVLGLGYAAPSSRLTRRPYNYIDGVLQPRKLNMDSMGCVTLRFGRKCALLKISKRNKGKPINRINPL